MEKVPEPVAVLGRLVGGAAGAEGLDCCCSLGLKGGGFLRFLLDGGGSDGGGLSGGIWAKRI